MNTQGPIAPQIRLITASDSIAELTDLLHRAYRRLAEQGLRFVASHQDEQRTLRRIEKGECYLALHQEKLVGTITFQNTAATDGAPWLDRPDVASFHQFAVDPGLQGRGIGSALLAHVERRAAGEATELALDTAEPASQLIRFYSARGYRFIEHVQWDCVNYRSVILSKRLK